MELQKFLQIAAKFLVRLWSILLSQKQNALTIMRALLVFDIVFLLGYALKLSIFDISSKDGRVIVQLGDLLFFNTGTIASLFDLIETAYLFAALLTLFLKDLKWAYRLFFFVVICAYPLLMSFLFMLRTEPSA